MPDYDFPSALAVRPGDPARDLFQAYWAVTIESFKSGKDGRVDLRYAADTDKLIVQVKHPLKTGLASLMRKPAKEAAAEAVKVRQLARLPAMSL